MEEKKKYAFGLDEENCFSDTFDTVDELIAFAKDAYENPDGNYWDEDMDDYSSIIYIGEARMITPFDFAPSLADIADQMTDKFYCDCNIAADDDVTIRNKAEAEKEWKAFVEKYFDIHYTIIADWIGIYDLAENKWMKSWELK